ncbi:MAG: hypothetical protein ACRDOU_10845 [Streptosporangiaceae bacterium]
MRQPSLDPSPGPSQRLRRESGPGRPSSSLTRTTFDHEGKPVEHGSHAYLADRYSFKMTLISH